MTKKNDKKVTAKVAPKATAKPAPKKAPPKPAPVDPKVEKAKNALIAELTNETYDQAVSDVCNLGLDALKDLKAKLDAEIAAKKGKRAKKKEAFASFCGSPFDPNPKATCTKKCKKDMPKEFAKCEEHFKATFEEKSSGTKEFKSKRKLHGKDFLGWGSGTSASMINLMLIPGKEEPYGHTIKEMMEQIGCPESRVRAHLGNLLKNFNDAMKCEKDKEGHYTIKSKNFLKKLTIGQL